MKFVKLDDSTYLRVDSNPPLSWNVRATGGGDTPYQLHIGDRVARQYADQEEAEEALTAAVTTLSDFVHVL